MMFLLKKSNVFFWWQFEYHTAGLGIAAMNYRKWGLQGALHWTTFTSPDSLYYMNDICPIIFIIAGTIYPSAENKVCLGQLGEEISESWVSPTFSQHYIKL